MQNAVVMTFEELKQHDEAVAKETAKQVAEAIVKTGGVSEPLPDVVSAKWILAHYSIYGLKYGTLNNLHNDIIREYGRNNEICYKRGSSVYYDRRKFEAWLLGKSFEKQQREKQDPHLKIIEGERQP